MLFTFFAFWGVEGGWVQQCTGKPTCKHDDGKTSRAKQMPKKGSIGGCAQ
jgi:hypothetical protein